MASRQEPTSATNFLDLPQEILLQIFDGLPAEDLCALSCAHRNFHSVADDDQLWAPLCNPLWEHSADSK